MTKDKERDEALIAEVARAISRKVDSFGDTERIEQQRAQLEWPRYREHAKAAIDALLRGDEPAKLDRYLEIWQEALMSSEHGDQAAAAVLRRHFEPPSEVVEAAEMVQRLSEGSAAGTYYASAKAIADFILKGGA